MSEPTWSRYDEAYKAIFEKFPFDLRSKINDCDKIEFTYDEEGDISTITFKKATLTLLTLTFAYDAQKNLTSITRS